jgi:hypothetical protein
MRPGTASPLATGTPVAPAMAAAVAASDARGVTTNLVAEFIDVCLCAIDVAFDGRELLPDVAVEEPRQMLLAYLLYLAATAPDDADPSRLADWLAHVDRGTWRLLHFSRAPRRLDIELAFSLIGRRQHQAPELRGLIALVQLLAGAELLRGLRA